MKLFGIVMFLEKAKNLGALEVKSRSRLQIF